MYHPQFLSQCTLAGKSILVQHILLALFRTLKYYVEGEHIDNHLGMALEEFYTSTDVSSSDSIRTMFTDEKSNLQPPLQQRKKAKDLLVIFLSMMTTKSRR